MNHHDIEYWLPEMTVESGQAYRNSLIKQGIIKPGTLGEFSSHRNKLIERKLLKPGNSINTKKANTGEVKYAIIH